MDTASTTSAAVASAIGTPAVRPVDLLATSVVRELLFRRWNTEFCLKKVTCVSDCRDSAAHSRYANFKKMQVTLKVGGAAKALLFDPKDDLYDILALMAEAIFASCALEVVSRGAHITILQLECFSCYEATFFLGYQEAPPLPAQMEKLTIQ